MFGSVSGRFIVLDSGGADLGARSNAPVLNLEVGYQST